MAKPIKWNSYRRRRARQELTARVDAATPDQWERGVQWYATANSWARSLAMRTPYSVDQVCGAIAALSPELSWENNQAEAVQLITAHAAGIDPAAAYTSQAYPAQLAKAVRILDGADPADVLRGPKESAFYHNLAGREEYVTLDRHAVTACGVEYGLHNRKLWREGMQRMYTIIARERGVTPAQLQAIVWTVERENMKQHAASQHAADDAAALAVVF